MTQALALIFLGILLLFHKHSLWKKALIGAAAVAALGILESGCNSNKNPYTVIEHTGDNEVSASDLYTVNERKGEEGVSIDDPWVSLTLVHDGKKFYVRCNNYKAATNKNKPVGCQLHVGQTVTCQFFTDSMSRDAGGYDFIGGNDRENGKLITSDKNELLQIDKENEGYLVTRSEPFIHHYEGSPCGALPSGLSSYNVEGSDAQQKSPPQSQIPPGLTAGKVLDKDTPVN